MATAVYTFADSTIRMKWSEPYVSEAFNREKVGTLPLGIYRGFDIVPHATLARTVYVKADAASGDNVAVVRSVNGTVEYGISVRLMSDIVLDLSTFANKTVALVLKAVYTTTSATTCTLQAYEVSPTNTLTADPDFQTLTVLGEVTVPGASALLSNSQITFQYRNEAWTTVGRQFRPWTQLLRNSSFNNGLSGIQELYKKDFLPFWSMTNDVNCAWALDTAVVHSRGKSARLSVTTVTPLTASMTQTLNTQVQPGQKIRVSAWTKSAETVQRKLEINFVDITGNPLTAVPVYLADTAGADFVQHSTILAVPDNAAGLASLLIRGDYTPAIIGAAFWIDDITVSVQDSDSTNDAWQMDGIQQELFTTALVLQDSTGFDYLSGVATGARLSCSGSQVTLDAKTSMSPSSLVVNGNIRAGNSSLPAQDTESFTADGSSTHLHAMRMQASGDPTSTRIYADGTATPGMLFTRNAFWNHSTSKWNRDVAQIATKVSLVDSQLQLHTHDAASSATPWDDTAPSWNRGLTSISLGGGSDIGASVTPGASTLWASNIPKCWGKVDITSAGPPNTIAIAAGFNIASATFVDPGATGKYDLKITFATVMANTNYTPLVQPLLYDDTSVRLLVIRDLQTGYFTIRAFMADGTTRKDLRSNADFAVNFSVQFTVFGNQG